MPRVWVSKLRVGKVACYNSFIMRLKRLELSGFKSFAKKTTLLFEAPIVGVVGPNGSGKSNVAEAFRWVLGEQSMKSLRGKRGEDLIWNGSDREPRSARAAATVVFNNEDRRLEVDFDEVAITREVHRDGENVYKLNGSVVRLRDVLELLARVSLGPSGHHIVSQGDADRLLSASPEERKAMIEDALGLKVYQWKLQESRRKLERTEENKKQVESLRREIAPHLKFLKKQVEKIEKADEFRRELKELYRIYLSREAHYLETEAVALKAKEDEPRRELVSLERELARLESLIGKAGTEQHRRRETLEAKERELGSLRIKKEELAHALGRLEGMIEAKAPEPSAPAVPVPTAKVEELLSEVREIIAAAEKAIEPNVLRRALRLVKERLEFFAQRHLSAPLEPDAALAELDAERERLHEALNRHELLWQAANEQYEQLKRSLAAERDDAFAAEREIFGLRARRAELLGALAATAAARETWQVESEAFNREIEEAAALVDQEVRTFAKLPVAGAEAREEQLKRRRELERLKIKLEDMGLEGTDVLKEYEQVSTRDEFLATELADLTTSGVALLKIMAELEADLEKNFKQGLEKINTEFSKLFALMFGGGEASLKLVWPEKRRFTKEGGEEEMAEDEAEQKPGIEIMVSLPRKKIRGLQMLSGGERALTSIALLFAIAAVNPPPFLVLDETDAALDEANSRKYGDMIERLAKTSQLILITHNRETMSRAGILYGVTMGSDGVSKLLSVRFDEAQSYAK